MALEVAPYPFIDGGAVLSYLITKKVVNLSLIVNNDTVEDLNNTLDNLKRRLARRERPFDILVN